MNAETTDSEREQTNGLAIMKTTNSTNKNVLTLNTCAYLFHWSSSNLYFGNKEQNDQHRKYNATLKKLSSASEKERTFEYVLNENGTPVIYCNDCAIGCTDKMLQSISGDFERCEIINARSFANLSSFDSDNWQKNIYKGGNASLYHQKYNSLHFDSFATDLLYYRMHFKNASYEFICANGKLYEANDQYKEITLHTIFKKLRIESESARKEVTKLVDYITK